MRNSPKLNEKLISKQSSKIHYIFIFLQFQYQYMKYFAYNLSLYDIFKIVESKNVMKTLTIPNRICIDLDRDF